jgi:lipopolysaccharide export system permease protein
MKTMRQLNVDLDSLIKMPDSIAKQTQKNLSAYVTYAKYKNSFTPEKEMVIAEKKIDTSNAKSFDDLIPEDLKPLVNDQALNVAGNTRNLLQIASSDFKSRNDDITQHKIEWHKKLSLSVACLVLFFIGAPLGSIIRKGGLGTPLVMALLFFMVFYLLNIFGEKFTKDNLVYPIFGMWLPVIVLSPVGFFLTYKAMHDSQLFNKEYYYRSIKKIGSATKRIFKTFGKK